MYFVCSLKHSEKLQNFYINMYIHIKTYFRTQEERKEACQKALEKSCQVRERQTQMYAKLKPLETTKSASKKSKAVQFGETSTTGPVTSKVSQARSKHIAEETRASINAFEATIKDRVSTGDEESEMTSLMSRQEDENPSSSRKIVSITCHLKNIRDDSTF